MDKILAVFTGGTISCKSEAVMTAGKTGGYRLIGEYLSGTGDDAEFESAAPLNILSENHTLSTMQALCNFLWKTDFSRYSGIIITHGSDTLSYITSLVAEIFGGSSIPIVLTAANRPIDDPESNGISNFTAAVRLIKTGRPGVFAVYSGRNGCEIFAGDRITEADGYFEEFSPFGEKFGEVNGADVRIFGDTLNNVSNIPPFEFKNGVLIIKSYPGIDYNVYNVSGAKAVLHVMYHSGTACIAGEETSFLRFAERCGEAGCPVYVLPFRKDGESLYSSAARIKESGVVPLPLMSLESAYAKLLIDVNLNAE